MISRCGETMFAGLSRDIKPSPAPGWGFIEVDTGVMYYGERDTWKQAPSASGAAWGAITGTLSNQTDLQTALNAKGTSNFSGIYADLTGKPALFSGVYDDLTGKPTLGTAAATNATAYATAAQGAKADTALQNAAAFATAAQGVKADSALQPAGSGAALTGLTKTQVGLANADNTTDAAKPVSTATQTALNLKANLTSPALVTPNIGVAAGTSLAATGAITSSGTAGMGYATGAGGAVTQATSKSTGVTLSKVCGEITLHNAALAAATIVSFTLTNTTIAATDVLILNHVTTGTRGAYSLNAQCAAGSAVIYVRNNTAGSLGEAIVIRFALIKGVVA